MTEKTQREPTSMLCDATDCNQPIRWMLDADGSRAGIEHVDPEITDHPAYRGTSDAPPRTKAQIKAESERPSRSQPISAFLPKRRKQRKRWVCGEDKGQVDLTVYISLPRSPSEPARLESLPGVKACRTCHAIYRTTKGDDA